MGGSENNNYVHNCGTSIDASEMSFHLQGTVMYMVNVTAGHPLPCLVASETLTSPRALDPDERLKLSCESFCMVKLSGPSDVATENTSANPTPSTLLRVSAAPSVGATLSTLGQASTAKCSLPTKQQRRSASGTNDSAISIRKLLVLGA